MLLWSSRVRDLFWVVLRHTGKRIGVHTYLSTDTHFVMRQNNRKRALWWENTHKCKLLCLRRLVKGDD